MIIVQPGIWVVAAAAGLDWLIGDPAQIVHPVVVMGWFIGTTRTLLERVAGDNPLALRLGGGVITLAVVLGLAGIQLFCFGLLGELLIRTYHESQGRPIYRIRETLRGGRAV